MSTALSRGLAVRGATNSAVHRGASAPHRTPSKIYSKIQEANTMDQIDKIVLILVILCGLGLIGDRKPSTYTVNGMAYEMVDE